MHLLHHTAWHSISSLCLILLPSPCPLYHWYPHLTVNVLSYVFKCFAAASVPPALTGDLDLRKHTSSCSSCFHNPLNNLQEEPFSLNYCFLILTLQTLPFLLKLRPPIPTSIPSAAALLLHGRPSSGSYTSFTLQQTYQEAKFL